MKARKTYGKQRSEKGESSRDSTFDRLLLNDS